MMSTLEGKPRPTFVFLPESGVSNAYPERMREILSSLGEVLPLQGRARFHRILWGEKARVDFLMVSWADNGLVARSGRVSLRGTLRFLARLVELKLLARKVIFIRHNLYPHATRPESAGLARWMVDRLESLFDAVFIHSGAESEDGARRYYVPHPLYQRDVAEPPSPALPRPYFIVFGRIKPYKRIEELMKRFPDDRILVVCGESNDRRYSAELARLQRPNIIYRPGYISEDEARAIVTGAQAVIIPNAEPHVIVSGAFFYAVSMQRPVFALRTPFLDWVKPRLGDDAVFLASDLDELCALVRDSPCAPLSPRTHRLAEDEFGDAAVRHSLESAFAEIGGRKPG